MTQPAFIRTQPADAAELRAELYRGGVYLLPADPISLELVTKARAELERELASEGDPRTAQFRLSAPEFFARIGRVRKRLYTGADFHDRLRDILRSRGLMVSQYAFDPIRLRTVLHDGHLNRAAAAVYHGHRDTWYANPQQQITVWIPLHDVTPAETFTFFLDDFATPVNNDSEGFDHDAWIARDRSKKIGWQNARTGIEAHYPRLLERPSPNNHLGVVAKAGELLIFSGQHLHRTRNNVTGRTRFSLDFRIVHLGDVDRGEGPPNVDNRSTGTALPDHVHPRGGEFRS